MRIDFAFSTSMTLIVLFEDGQTAYVRKRDLINAMKSNLDGRSDSFRFVRRRLGLSVAKTGSLLTAVAFHIHENGYGVCAFVPLEL